MRDVEHFIGCDSIDRKERLLANGSNRKRNCSTIILAIVILINYILGPK